MKMFKTIINAMVAATGLVCAGSAMGTVLTYDLDWTGAGGYTMTGSFDFDDTNGADGRIDETELLALGIEGFLNGISVGAWNLTSGHIGAEPFNFNFDPVTEAFFLGGNSTGLDGQNWNSDGNTGTSCGTPGFGFNNGSSTADLCVNGVNQGATTNLFALTASRQVPEPGTLVLIGIGIAGLVARSARKSGSAGKSEALRTVTA